MKRIATIGRALCGAVLGTAMLAGTAQAQGPQVNIQAVTQPSPAIPQYTRVDIPLLREGLAQQSNGRIRVTLSSWPERNLNGPEIVRLVRSGQVEIGGVPLNTVAGDVPMLDMADLAGLNPTIGQARQVAVPKQDGGTLVDMADQQPCTMLLVSCHWVRCIPGCRWPFQPCL
jgi:TRAP-type C4-dicarboxylate transport system substrate-binding protein